MPLKVFSGKEAKLNRIILLLSRQRVLTKHDIFLEVRRIKGCRHKTSGTVGRRINALCVGGYISSVGTRPSKVQGECEVYGITLKGKAALRFDKKSNEEFLDTANNQELSTFLDIY
jgi:hypothetical protein